jgi:hypothetical protein
MKLILLFLSLLATDISFAQHKPAHHRKHTHTARPKIVLQWIPTLPERCFDTDVPGYVAQLPELKIKPTTQTVDILVLSPLINYNPGPGKTYLATEIKTLPYTNINDVVSLTAGAYQKQRGAQICMDGGRGDGNVYIIDGMYALQR